MQKILVLWVLTASLTLAQTFTGSISGLVKDPSGAVVITRYSADLLKAAADAGQYSEQLSH